VLDGLQSLQRVGVGGLGRGVGARTRSEGLDELGVKRRSLGADRLNCCPYPPNNAAIAPDTSSAPAATTAVVCADAAGWPRSPPNPDQSNSMPRRRRFRALRTRTTSHTYHQSSETHENAMRSTSIPNSTVSQLISKIPGYRAHSVDDCHAEQCSPILRGRNTATCAIPPALTFRPKWRKFGGSNVRPPAKIVTTVQGSPRSCCPWIRRTCGHINIARAHAATRSPQGTLSNSKNCR
jgi:hypothetical protein